MLPAEKEKRKAAITKEITEQQKDLFREDAAALSRFIEQACLLRAELQDSTSDTSIVPNSVNELNSLRTSNEWIEAHKRGLLEDLRTSVDEIRDPEVHTVTALLIENCPDEGIADPSIIREAIGSTQPARISTNSFEADSAHADVPDHVRAFLWMERIRKTAWNKLTRTLAELLNPELTLPLERGAEEFWRIKLFNEEHPERGIAFLQGYIERMEHEVASASHAIYGAQADRAVTLWRAILYLRGWQKVTPDIKKFRLKFIEAMNGKKFDEAEILLANALKNMSVPVDDKTKQYIGRHVSQESAQDLFTKKTASPLIRRLEEELIPFARLQGTTYKTRGKRHVKISRTGKDIRYTNKGPQPGIEIVYLVKDRWRPLSTELIEGKREILTPAQLRYKMELEQWEQIAIRKDEPRGD